MGIRLFLLFIKKKKKDKCLTCVHSLVSFHPEIHLYKWNYQPIPKPLGNCPSPVLSFSVPKTLIGVPRTCVYQRALSEEACAAPTGPQHWRGSERHRRPVQWRRAQGSHALQPVHIQERWEQVTLLGPDRASANPGQIACQTWDGFAFILWVFVFLKCFV